MLRTPTRITLGLLLAASLLFTSCSSDDGGSNSDNAGATTTTVFEVDPEWVEYCEVAAESSERSETDPIGVAEEQLAVAPPELAEHGDKVLVWLQLREAGTDQAAIDAAWVEAEPAFARVVELQRDECNIIVDLGL